MERDTVGDTRIYKHLKVLVYFDVGKLLEAKGKCVLVNSYMARVICIHCESIHFIQISTISFLDELILKLKHVCW